MPKGARGYITNAGVRDPNEVILQKIPFWSKFVSQSRVQGRVQLGAKDIPVAVGGVVVYPGDLIAADVARYAHRELRTDKIARRAQYEALGMELDDTVRY